jgi:hypothetical protein
VTERKTQARRCQRTAPFLRGRGRSDLHSVAVVVNRDSVQEVEGKVPDQTEQGAVVENRTVLGGSRVVSTIRRIGVDGTRPGAVLVNRAAPG